MDQPIPQLEMPTDGKVLRTALPPRLDRWLELLRWILPVLAVATILLLPSHRLTPPFTVGTRFFAMLLVGASLGIARVRDPLGRPRNAWFMPLSYVVLAIIFLAMSLLNVFQMKDDNFAFTLFCGLAVGSFLVLLWAKIRGLKVSLTT